MKFELYTDFMSQNNLPLIFPLQTFNNVKTLCSLQTLRKQVVGQTEAKATICSSLVYVVASY